MFEIRMVVFQNTCLALLEREKFYLPFSTLTLMIHTSKIIKLKSHMHLKNVVRKRGLTGGSYLYVNFALCRKIKSTLSTRNRQTKRSFFDR